MGLSVIERIAVNNLTTLQNVITENGYQLTIARATSKNEPQHLSGFIFQLTPEPVEDAMIGTDERLQPFAVVVYVIPSETDTTPVDTYNNDIAAALEKAIQTDVTRGGLALNTIYKQTLYFPPIAGDVCGITFLFDVHYRTGLYQPYQSLS